MSSEKKLSPLAKAIGISIVAGLTAMPVANAASNPFAMSDLEAGYKVAAEGKCGGMKSDKKSEGKCGGDKKSMKEGKCGEGKKKSEGKCGGDKKSMKEGKCGEGKCGGKK
ncbi:MAG: hypothetical protein IME93_00040 [Proteobacteria bacterium]|nr:hypothetical protein [Pseudomonadota bacterium]